MKPPYLFEAINHRESSESLVCELRDVPAAPGIFPITLGVQLSHQGTRNVRDIGSLGGDPTATVVIR